MIHYLSAEDVIQINLRHCPDSSGVVDRGGVEGACGRPLTGFEGHEEYPDVWSKAAVLLHGIASTQYFTNGNKRTGWLAASAFLLANGSPLRISPMISREAFVVAVATGVFSVPQAAEWFKENRERASDLLDFAVLALHAEEGVQNGVWNGSDCNLAGVSLGGIPHAMPLHIVFRIKWRKFDLHKIQEITASLHTVSQGTDPAVFATGKNDMVLDRTQPVQTGHRNHSNGIMPYIGVMELPLVLVAEGRIRVVLRLNGDVLASLPLDVTLLPDFSAAGSFESAVRTLLDRA
ncbi:Fic family protein [Arthrobacter sp. H35-D1]|uniref:type II toxin-antitoxin system death-on-curing family toxin n=1 Tax=Arthrobacter sp. H35-D1 TaxID=3046202 RepID=UPI0024B9D449|nr:Fic family protein [Arthrobacter sp. H35-D1]MDJ0314017.1 Fic family protein [Arthrobacter sp. H35-D1]